MRKQIEQVESIDINMSNSSTTTTTSTTTSTPASNLYAILMDSDTVFSVSDISELWNKYDCAIETANKYNNPDKLHKNILMSTETSCWIGQFCTPQNISMYYGTKPNTVPYLNSWGTHKELNKYNNILDTTPSYSPFANSGVMMGSMNELLLMLEYVNENSNKYYLYAPHKNNKYIFDDQYAYTDYCLNIKPSRCGLDFHQQISASVGMTFQDVLVEHDTNKLPFVCMTSNGDVSYRCPDVLSVLNRQKGGYYQFNSDTCRITRSPHNEYNNNRKYAAQLLTLSPTPAIIHGNGGGKRFLYGDNDKHPGYQAFKCYLSKYRAMNVSTYTTTEAYEQWYSRKNTY